MIAALNKENTIDGKGQSSAADNPRASSAVIEYVKPIKTLRIYNAYKTVLL
jgi:hypothetical protein